MLVCTSTYQQVLVQASTYSYIPAHTSTYLYIPYVCWYVQVHTRTYHHELHCNSFSYGIGFRGAIRDEPGLSERYVPAQESVLDEDQDRNPCQEDEEFFESLPNAEEMEQAIGKFLDGMPAVESKGYEQLHRHLARLPVPEKKIISAISHTEAVE